MYNGAVRNVIGGLPDYIFATIMWYLLAVIVGIAATLQWDVAEADSQDEDAGTKTEMTETKKHAVVASGSVNGVTAETEKETETVETADANGVSAGVSPSPEGDGADDGTIR